MESELNQDPDKRWLDFVKLVDVSADRRLFLGKAHVRDWTTAASIIEEWAQWLECHRHLRGCDEIGVVLICGGANWPFAGWIIRGDGSYGEVLRVDNCDQLRGQQPSRLRRLHASHRIWWRTTVVGRHACLPTGGA